MLNLLNYYVKLIISLIITDINFNCSIIKCNIEFQYFPNNLLQIGKTLQLLWNISDKDLLPVIVKRYSKTSKIEKNIEIILDITIKYQ